MAKQAESLIVHAIRRSAGYQGCRLWRNDNGAYQAKNGNWVSYGLGKGTSDLIGLKQLRITEDMVGQKIAQFVAVEVKQPGKKSRATKEQKAFIDEVQSYGARAAVVDSVEEAMEILS